MTTQPSDENEEKLRLITECSDYIIEYLKAKGMTPSMALTACAIALCDILASEDCDGSGDKQAAFERMIEYMRQLFEDAQELHKTDLHPTG